MVKTRISDGVTLLGRYEPCQCGSFVLHNNGEAYIVEMPPCRNSVRNPWKDAKIFIERNQLQLKGLLVTHAHRDHTASYDRFRLTFPNAPLYLHSSLKGKLGYGVNEVYFSSPVLHLDVGGELLLLIHAPKHSKEDQLIFFKGTVCSGDWSLGQAPDCNNYVPTVQKIKTLSFVRRYLMKLRYFVHTAYSAHANELRRPISFWDMLTEMESYWSAQVLEKAA